MRVCLDPQKLEHKLVNFKAPRERERESKSCLLIVKVALAVQEACKVLSSMAAWAPPYMLTMALN